MHGFRAVRLVLVIYPVPTDDPVKPETGDSRLWRVGLLGVRVGVGLPQTPTPPTPVATKAGLGHSSQAAGRQTFLLLSYPLRPRSQK